MSASTIAEIVKSEERLRQAMLESDVDALDELLSAELVFTNHLGYVMSKEDDLSAHKSGLLKIDSLTTSDERIQLMNDVAIVCVHAHILGRFDGEASENDFRFTRVWAVSSTGAWQVVNGHSCIVIQ